MQSFRVRRSTLDTAHPALSLGAGSSVSRLSGALLALLCLASVGCQKGGSGAKDGGESYDPYEEPGPEPKMSERTLPECKLEGPLPEFPAETEGLAFRGLVRLVIGSDGRPTDVCFARAEGPLLYEKRALAGKGAWKYDPAFAGQPREKVVTYRLNPKP